MSFCHKLGFSNFNIVATQCRRPFIFQTMNSVRPKNLSLKYKRFTSSDRKDIGIRKFEFVTKTQFLYSVTVPVVSEQNLWNIHVCIFHLKIMKMLKLFSLAIFKIDSGVYA